MTTPSGPTAPGGPTPVPPSPPPASCSSPGQYVDVVFQDVQVTRNIRFSIVADAFGAHELFLDVYRGRGDTAVRPAMIWAFGGGFETGGKSQLSNFATEFARRGYVSVAIEYRTLRAYDPNATGPQAQAVAQSDAQAAVRFLRLRATELGIDSGRIGIGGWSAGSITAFNVGYNYEFMGDNTENAGPPHTVMSVLGLDGFSPAAMQPNDPPFVLFRAGRGSDEDDPSAFPNLIARANNVQLSYEVHVVSGARHNDLIRAPYDQTIIGLAAPFLRRTLGCR